MYLLCLAVAQIIWVTTVQGHLGQYYHSNVTVISPPARLPEDSFFGFSIAYYPWTNGLIISAPKQNKNGVIYTCDIKSWQCEELKSNLSRVEGYDHDYWFGATVRAGKDFFVTCAPRFTMKSENYENSFGSFGHCYNWKKNYTTMHPMRLQMNADVIRNTEKLEQTMDSLGWSMDMDTGNAQISKSSLLVGGPAMFKGRVIQYKDLKLQPNLIYPKHYNTKDFANYNIGYSVAIGYFVKGLILSYAIGSPYGENGIGRVQILKEVRGRLYVVPLIQGDSVGSMFGAVLCAASLTGRRTDLLVGAPAFAAGTLSTYNIGAVYVYVANKNREVPLLKRLIKGQKVGGYFGSAIVDIGDLNGDKCDEVAIAAPYEGNGVVYLYSGSDLLSDKNKLTALQRIESPGPYRPFGLSLAVANDYDDNGCNELAIGAPFNDTVVVIKCFSAVTVKKLQADFSDLQSRSRGPKRASYFMKVCFEVTYPPKPVAISAEIKTKVSLRHDAAVLKAPNADKSFAFITSLKNKQQQQYCKNIDVIVPEEGNYEEPIFYKIELELVDNPLNREFDPTRVLLSDKSDVKVKDNAWIANCRGVQCEPILKLNFQDTMGPIYTIGTNVEESFSLIVSNTGELAYDPCIRVIVHNALVSRNPSVCGAVGDALQCRPGKPLGTNGTWTISNFSLETTHLSNQLGSIKVEVMLYDRCKDIEQNPSNYTRQIKEVRLKADPKGIEIKGECSVKDIIHMTSSEMQVDTRKPYEHIYTMINDEVVIWENLQLEVELENKPYLDYTSFDISIDGEPSDLECEELGKNDHYIRHNCTIAKVEKGRSIMLLLNIIPNKLKDYFNENNTIIFNSNLTIFFENSVKVSSVSTIIQLSDVPVWIIVCATLLGLLLVIIIVVILYKCGCLRRKSKEKLKDLRQSVKRQSRQSMRRSVMPPTLQQQANSDQNRILSHIEENE